MAKTSGVPVGTSISVVNLLTELPLDEVQVPEAGGEATQWRKLLARRLGQALGAQFPEGINSNHLSQIPKALAALPTSMRELDANALSAISSLIQRQIRTALRMEEPAPVLQTKEPGVPKKTTRLSKDDEVEMFRYLKENRPDSILAHNIIVMANQGLVAGEARRLCRGGDNFNDLLQEGNIGLMKAIEKFDYTRGYKFCTYAIWWIRQAMSRSIGKSSRTIRLPADQILVLNKVNNLIKESIGSNKPQPSLQEMAEVLNIPPAKLQALLEIAQEPVPLDAPVSNSDAGQGSRVGDLIPDSDASAPDKKLEEADRRAQVQNGLSILTDQEREVIELRFGFTEEKPMSLSEIGERLSLSRERIRQIEEKALKKIQKHLGVNL